MRKLIAMALLGAGAVFFSANAPAQAMTAGSAGVTKSAAAAESQVVEVRRRHRHWRHRHWRHRHRHHRRWYRPYYYGGYYPYYGYRYHRRPRVGIYLSF
ncbi:MAG: hypothetical protein AB7S70_15275 [Hyphomicrobium sp.]|uniref:hypothetical protein n=1 Tax=Hyphomicrobium sp. TaxID=82 RepID=UPI003D0D1A8B